MQRLRGNVVIIHKVFQNHPIPCFYFTPIIKIILMTLETRLLSHTVWGYKLYALSFRRHYSVSTSLDDPKLVVFEKVEKEAESG